MHLSGESVVSPTNSEEMCGLICILSTAYHLIVLIINEFQISWLMMITDQVFGVNITHGGTSCDL